MSDIAATLTLPSKRRGLVFPNFEILVGTLLVFFHMLMPLDRGFPGLPVGGHQLGAPMAATLVSYLAIIVSSRGAVISRLSRPFAILQALVVLLMLPGIMGAKDSFLAINLTIRSFTTFVLDYSIFVYLIERHGYKWLTKAVVFAGCLAACIAVVDTFFGFRIPFYQKIFESNNVQETGDVLFDLMRGVGTMGNPIVMAVLMMLCVPYVFGIRSSTLRVLALCLLTAGAAVTVSRTVGIGIIVYAVGAAFVYKRKFWNVMAIVTGFLVIVAITSFGTSLADDPRIQFWATRVGIGSGNGVVDESVSIRGTATRLAFKRIQEEWGPKQFLLGEGLQAGNTVGENATSGLETLDNTTTTILYERGIISLILFYFSFLAILWKSRAHAKTTLHWYSGIALILCGISFDFEAYATFNLLAVASLAIISAIHAETKVTTEASTELSPP